MKRHRSEERDTDFTLFVQHSGPRLVHFAELLTGDPDRAADLAQASLEKAYRRWGGIQAEDPYGYVRRIIVNQHTEWWRRSRGREQLTGQHPETVMRDDLAEDQAQRALVNEALRSLTRRERSVVVLRYHLDLSEAAIAADLGIALGTVKSTLSRALVKLRACPALQVAQDERRKVKP